MILIVLISRGVKPERNWRIKRKRGPRSWELAIVCKEVIDELAGGWEVLKDERIKERKDQTWK